jgi:hypothetical protein
VTVTPAAAGLAVLTGSPAGRVRMPMYTRRVGYEWITVVLAKLIDVEPHEPDEVMQVLGSASRWPRPAVGLGGVRVLTVWGRTGTGRALMVALRRKDEWDWWIAGARELNPAELAELEQWEAGHE